MFQCQMDAIPVLGTQNAKREIGGREEQEKNPVMFFMNEFKDSIYTISQ